MPTLLERVASARVAGAEHAILAPGASLSWDDVERLCAGGIEESLADAVVAMRFATPLSFVRQLLLLDGQVGDLLLMTAGLSDEMAAALMAGAQGDRLLGDDDMIEGYPAIARRSAATRWLLTTSGTTGAPKVVRQDLDALIRSVKPAVPGQPQPIWGLLYDPSRFAGLQVVLQSLLGGGVLAIPDPDDDMGTRVAFLREAGCTHLSATPSLWRKLLMLPEAASLPLHQVSLGGEIADDKLLRALRARYPQARVTHIYASTEIGVGFAVNDGRAGFPVDYLGSTALGVDLKVEDGMLWARPPEASARVVRDHLRIDDAGYVCTEDRVEIVGDRVEYRGRQSSLVNIGGTKVQIEDVEAIIAQHPGVAQCVVRARPNPILGAVLGLTVVGADPAGDPAALKTEVKKWCRERLPREAQPVTIAIVDSIDVTAAGKIVRN